jgi:hypothetical protein
MEREKGFEHLRRVNANHATVHAFLSFHPSLPLIESPIRFPMLSHPSPGFSQRPGDIRETGHIGASLVSPRSQALAQSEPSQVP